MIRHLKNREIDRNQWDKCVQLAVNQRIYGYSWYLDLVCDDWNALVLDDYIAVFPLPFRRKFGFRYAYTPWFVQQLGLFCKSADQFQLIDDFIDLIRKKYILADIYLQNETFPVRYPVVIRDNYELALKPDYATIAEKYNMNLRRNLQLGIKHDLQVISHADAGAIISMFRAGRGAGVLHWKESDYLRFRRLFHALEHKGYARSWGAYTPANQLIAGAVFFFDQKHSILIFSGVTEEGKEKRAMPLIIDTVIRQMTGVTSVLDFEGSMDPGLARFYASFGASVKHFWFLRTTRFPFRLKH